MRLIILGSSSGLASKTREATCYLFDCGDHGVFFDLGDGATRNFLAASYAPEWISHIVITHTHADHLGGLWYFLQQRYLSGTNQRLTIHCPGEAVGPIKAVFNLGYMFKEKLPFTIEYKPHVEHHAFAAGALRVTPYPTSHLAEAGRCAASKGLPNRGECYAQRIEAGEKVILYSADLGSLGDLDSVPGPIDWLLVESTHTPLDRLWPWAEERTIKRIIITHIAEDFDLTKVDAGKTRTTAEILIAADGLSLDI